MSWGSGVGKNAPYVVLEDDDVDPYLQFDEMNIYLSSGLVPVHVLFRFSASACLEAGVGASCGQECTVRSAGGR
jgi:hypothetical protein